MVLHLGKDYIVPIKDVIFIFEYKNAVNNKDTKNYINNLEKNVEKLYITKKNIKSIVYVKMMGKKYLYYSPISSATLYKRSNNL